MDHNISKSDTPVKDLRSNVHGTVDKVADTLNSTVDKVADNISSIGDQMGVRTDQLGAAYKRFAESGANYVRKSPGTSVLVALAAGYAVSKLLGSRKH